MCINPVKNNRKIKIEIHTEQQHTETPFYAIERVF